LGLRPLERVERAAEDIAAGDLSRRVPPGPSGTEIGRLSTTLNAMLEQIESAFAAREKSATALRQFVADASHELRTPLTRLNTRAQLVERSLRKGETDRAAAESQRLIEDGRALSTVLEDLLAAAEPVSESTWTLIDLAEVASTGAAAVAIEATQAEVEVVLDPAPPRAALARGGRPALERTVVALLDNAIRHTPPAGTVTVSAGTEPRWRTVRVAVSASGSPWSPTRRSGSAGRWTCRPGPPAPASRSGFLGPRTRASRPEPGQVLSFL
jgi:two-component system OmpR family sensor kinase